MSSSGISHIDQAETRNDTAFTRNATRYPKLADATPPSAAPTVISRKRDENINALPASRPSSPVMFGIEAFFAASKKAVNSANNAVHTYAIHSCSGLFTSRNPSATIARAKSATIITWRLDHRSTNTPAKGAKAENGTRRQTSKMAVATGAADVTVRIRPSAAMKLNQLPSSETTWPPHSNLNDLLFTINCL